MRVSNISFKYGYFTFLLLLFVLCFSINLSAQMQAEKIKLLRQEAGKIYKNVELFEVNDRTATPKAIQGNLAQNIDFNNTGQIIKFLKNSEKVFRINPNSDDFTVKKKFTDKLHLNHVRLQQTYNGIPVCGAELAVHSDRNNTVYQVNGRFTPDLILDTKPSITRGNALQIALSDLGPAEYRWQNPEQEKLIKELNKDETSSWEPKPSLVIEPRNGDFDNGEYRLAWQMTIAVDGKKSGDYEYFIDALTGEILLKYNQIYYYNALPGDDFNCTGPSHYNGTVPFAAGYNSTTSQYDMSDPDRNIRTYTATDGIYSLVHLPGNIETSSSNYFRDLSTVDAHWGATQVYDFYKDIFQRNSYDGQGAQVRSTVHCIDRDGDQNLAAWSTSYHQMYFGDGDDTRYSSLTALEVVGHEFTHGVITSESILDYFNGGLAAPAIQEAVCDIMGTLVEFEKTPAKADWWLAEDCYTPGTSGDALRYMDNPKRGGQPNTYQGTNWYYGTDPQTAGHTNSGILTYAFYLMCVGGSGTNDKQVSYSVDPITKQEARVILYRAITADYLTLTSDFSDLRTAFLSSAADLYGINSKQYKTVSDAFGAVGIGVRFTAENSFNAGKIKINGFETSSGSNFFAAEGNTQTLEAIQQDYTNAQNNTTYHYVWNTSGSPLSISQWEKRSGIDGTIGYIPYAYSISYSLNPLLTDQNSAFIADMMKSYYITRMDNTEFDGNISAGVVASVVEQNSGTVSAPLQKTVSSSGRTYSFAGWKNGGNGTVAPTSDMTMEALYKILNKSNSSNAFTNSSQKKTKSDGVNSILVYESMNSIWMESSANMGTSWTIQNFGKPVSSPGIAHDPSIDGTDGAEHFYLVGYAAPDATTNTTKIMAAEVNGSPEPVNQVVYDNIPGSTYDTQPVVACLITSAGQKAIMIWRQPATDGFGGTLPAGLYYRTGSITGTHVDWDVYNNGIYIKGTDINSFNPTVAGVRDQVYAIPMVFHLAYSQKVGNQSIIKYTSFTINNADGTVSQAPLIPTEISDPIYEGSYYQLNEKPSITLVNNLPYVAWKNYSDATYMQTAVLRWKTSASAWSGTYHYAGKDDDATSVHISNTGNMSSGYKNFVLGWNTSYSGDQFVKSTSLSNIYGLSTYGQGIQVMGGGDFNNSYLISFHNSSLPYSFSSSNAISAGTLAKVTSDGEGRTVEERSGLIKLNNFFIKASLGDLTLNGSKVDFKEPKDSLIGSFEHFKASLETESIDVTNSGILSYTAGFEYSDSLKALSLIKEGSHVGFSVEIVDAETGLVLKKLNSFVLSPSSHKREHAQNFRLDLSGIGTRKVALRLSSNLSLKDSTKAEYFVQRYYAVQRKAKKDNFVDLNYSEGARVTEYGLSQNYPNPFNPTTVISYQIPKASKVTLKIYDMLGKEVTTLVNGYKEQGKYSVEFNASNLPSGTYIYEIRANDFVKSGKMMLLK